eukprot:292369_1
MGLATSIADTMQSSMKETMKENTKTMIQNQQRMQMQVREMKMAVNMARMRDIFKFYASFTGTVMVLGVIGTIKMKHPGPLLPSLPLSWVCAFQYDMAYGNKLQRVRREAGQILDDKWRLGDDNPFLLPENNLLMDRLTYDAYTSRDSDDNIEQS